ncbi:MAG: RDD family protein [Candidatus Hermodarchaeota archaeon]
MTEKSKSIFLVRAVALFIDVAIFFPLGFLIAIIIDVVTNGAPVSPLDVYIRVIICFSIPFWVYSILCDFSESGSTIGKKVMKLHVKTLEMERLRLYQAISRTAIKLIPWEMTHLTFFGFSEGWGTFNMVQIILIVILYGLIFVYIIIMIRTKGVKGIHDIISHTQIKSIKKS